MLTDALRRFGRLDDADLAGLDLAVHGFRAIPTASTGAPA